MPFDFFIERDITLNKDLYNLVEGKRVAVIGPAPYLLEKGMGALIDDYDIVVRPNEIIPPRDIRCDYGDRTDILFCNFGTIWMPGIKRKIALDDHEEYFKKLKLVVACGIKTVHADTDYLSWPDERVSDLVKNFNEINSYGLPFYWIGVKDYKILHSKVGVEYNTGIGAIMMLLQYPVRELYVTGFSFYKGGNSYDELYYPGHTDEHDQQGRPCGFNAGHGARANQRQLDYFKHMAQTNSDVLRVDSYIDHLLQLNHP